MRDRSAIASSNPGIVCLAAVADTGAQSNSWRQCVADTTPAAIEACTSVIFLDPKNDGAFINRGIAYRRIGDLERALSDYNEAIRLNPLAADAFNNRGNAFQELNRVRPGDPGLRRGDSAEPALCARVQQSRRHLSRSRASPIGPPPTSTRRSAAIPPTPMRFATVDWRAPINAVRSRAEGLRRRLQVES